MADEFIDVGIETDEQTLADLAIDRLEAEWVGWTANEGDLEVVQIEALAPMAADAALTASVVPAVILRTFLEELHGIAYQPGVSATTTATFTFVTSGTYTIPEGTEIDVDGFAFVVDDDTTVTGTTAANVPVTAAEPGVDFNDLAGDLVVLITSLAFVASVDTNAVTAGGIDPESLDDYLDRGVQELQLTARTLVTTHDYELMTLSLPYVGRVVALSNATTRTITVYPANLTAAPLTSAQKTELTNLLTDYRLTTWTLSIADSNTVTVNVNYTARAHPGYVVADVVTRVNEALTDFLKPLDWGLPREFGDIVSSRWYAETRVRKNRIIELIGMVEGVDYVTDVTLTGSSGTVEANGDYLMTGTVPLATIGTIAATVTV